MHRRTVAAFGILAILAILAPAAPARAQAPGAIADGFAEVNGTTLHYLIAGQDDPVILLHGYPQTSHMWRPLMAVLAKTHTVVAPDLRGAGQSARPEAGYDKKTMAQDIHALAASLGFRTVKVAGHDIGTMVAYAYAAQYPMEVRRLALLDGYLPGIGDWPNAWLSPALWHHHFYGETALGLVAGREALYFEHFWNDFAADKTRSVSADDRRLYAAAYAQPGAMRAGFEYFRAFERDAADFHKFARSQLATPTLVLVGETPAGDFLNRQARLVAVNVETITLEGAGHWLMEEAPAKATALLESFFGGPP
jgi:pimeloyl-ACP methyl ester carboxylesterase